MRGRRPVELSVVPLFSLIQKANLGEPHPVLAGGEGYVSPRFAAAWERELQQDFVAAGLGERDAMREFVDTLALVQRAGTEYYGWVNTPGESYALLVALAGRRATVAVRVGDRVSFDWVDPDRVVECLVQRLPQVPAGRGDAISVPAETMNARRNGVLRRSNPRPDAAKRLDTLLKAKRIGIAKLYAARRDQDGRRRSAEWLTVLDLADGRWVLYKTRGTINAMPATPQALVAKLGELR